MDKARGELIQDVRNMTQQLEHSREKLGRSRTEREANAAQRELEELRKLVRDREEEIGKLTADADAVPPADRGTTEAEHKKLAGRARRPREGDISSKLGEVDGKAQGEAGRARRRRQGAAAAALSPLRHDPVQARERPSRRRRDGTCKACHMALPPQLFHRLRREPILEQCPSCNRIIYFAAPLGCGRRVDAELKQTSQANGVRPEAEQGPRPLDQPRTSAGRARG